MKRLDVIKCLIISPQDVQAEREAVANVLERWNGQIGTTLDVLIHPVRWETHSTPELGSHPQTILNRQIVKDCDCAVAVFWSRLGTPTAKADSGSLEEIEEVLIRGGQVLVYVCKRDIPQSLLDTDQLARLNAALDVLRKRGLVFEYRSLEELQMLLMGHFTGMANKILTAMNGDTGELRQNGHTNAKVDSSIPDIRVKASWGLPTGMGPKPRSILCAELQNHSSQPFYFQSIYIELSDGRSMVPVTDAFDRPIQEKTKLDPGANLSLYFDFAHMLERAEQANGAKLKRFVVRDQIDRQFYSTENDMEIAISNFMKWNEKS